jgi:hypothetical protein
MLTVLGGLAEFERSLSIARRSEGRALAKASGVRFLEWPTGFRSSRRRIIKAALIAEPGIHARDFSHPSLSLPQPVFAPSPAIHEYLKL